MEFILLTHKITAGLFLIIYLAKGFIIFKSESSRNKIFSKLKFLEMPISFLFLGTGVYLLILMGDPPPVLIIKLLIVVLAIPLAIIGQKKSKPIFLWISILLLVYIFGVSETRSLSFQKPTMEYLANDGENPNFELLNLGSHIYGEHCLKCHGKSGDLERYGAIKLINSSISPELLETIIVQGKGNMPAFSKKLDQKELQAVKIFIQNFRKQ